MRMRPASRRPRRTREGTGRVPARDSPRLVRFHHSPNRPRVNNPVQVKTVTHTIELDSLRLGPPDPSENAGGPRAVRTARCPWRETLVGALLGTGAPAGALLLRILGGVRDVPAEIAANAFFYLYALVSTSLVFGLAGCLEGRRADRTARAATSTGIWPSTTS